MLRRLLAAALVVSAIPALAVATTYAPVSFDDLVARADVIFVGQVIDVRPYLANTRQGPVVKTRVFFDVSDRLQGTGGAIEVLEFLGGEVGDVGLRVEGMPTFTLGDRRVVFARRTPGLNPIVGFTQGLMRIQRDAAGIDRVLTLDGVPLDRPESVGLQVSAARRASVPMRLADFRGRIASAVAARGVR
jgi:hypothetical protein